jgi:hypothetical protein
MMQVLGRNDEAERQHELAELGTEGAARGPIQALCETRTLAGLKTHFDAAVSALEERVAVTGPADPQLPYYRTLLVLTKKVELDLENQIEGLTRLYQNLEDMHDFVHELYPVK